MHLLRLLETGLEVLQRGDLRVRRPNAEELLAVRAGALTFDQLLERATELQTQMHEALLGCSLPEAVDHTSVDELAQSLIAASPHYQRR